jgi:GTP-binding protein
MMQTLSLAVVGHTNTGKTSLMRTLLRDSRFGEVQNAAATTRHVAQAALGDGVETWLYLHDTPGLEDAGGVLDWLEENTSPQHEGIERLQQFLDSPAAQNEWAQEAKVLRQVLASDAALYVVDAREDVLPKYKDELTVLSWCAKPVMPVFNFIHGQNMDEWQTLLARRSLHVSSRFDTVAFDFSGEMVLWQQLATLLGQPPALSALTAFRQQEWQQLERQAYVLVAQFLLDAAACVRQFEDKSRSQAVLEEMQAAVAAHESSLHQQLFALYRFYYSDADIQGQQVLRAFRQNPFDAELLKDYGIRTGKAAATGALLGLGVDALTLGTSLGLGATIGGVLGGLAGNWQVLYDKIQGIETLMIDNATLTLLAARSLHLLQTLKSRGHAATNSVVLQDKVALPWKADALPKVLQQARLQPKWSALNPSYEPQSRKRQEAVEALAARLAGQE